MFPNPHYFFKGQVLVWVSTDSEERGIYFISKLTWATTQSGWDIHFDNWIFSTQAITGIVEPQRSIRISWNRLNTFHVKYENRLFVNRESLGACAQQRAPKERKMRRVSLAFLCGRLVTFKLKFQLGLKNTRETIDDYSINLGTETDKAIHTIQFGANTITK
jgi:hypothetical protein